MTIFLSKTNHHEHPVQQKVTYEPFTSSPASFQDYIYPSKSCSYAHFQSANETLKRAGCERLRSGLSIDQPEAEEMVARKQQGLRRRYLVIRLTWNVQIHA